MEAHRSPPEVVLAILVLLVFVSCFARAQNNPLRNDTERSALFDLRSSLGLRAKDWPRRSEPCWNWTGVACQNGRVVGISVSGLQRTHAGRVNPQFAVDSLANLSLLATFNSSGFELPGSIPDWLGQSLSALQVLDLRSASVKGPIPQSLGSLGSLHSLYLSGNSLTGAIPSQLGQLSALSVLNLSQNSLTGSIPQTFSTLSNLTSLDLSSNYLSGSVPSGLANLTKLQFLNLSSNILTASIPNQLGQLFQLVELDLSLNNLMGTVPVDLGGLRSLQKMLLGNNGLQGSLSDKLFSNLTRLQFLVLSDNKIEGDIPGVLWSMHELRFLDVSGNNFTGVLANLSWNVNSTNTMFNLSNNLFYGALPTPLGKFSLIDLSGNYFQGKVPNDIETNTSLNRNCLQSVLDQRSLEDCRLFYAERNLSFDNFGAPSPAQPPLPGSSTNSSKRWIFILVGLFGGLGFIVLLVLVLVLLIRRCDKRIASQREIANVGPAPEGRSPLPAKVSINFSGVGDLFTYEQILCYTDGFSEINLIKHGHSGDLFRGILESGAPVVVKRVDLRALKKESYMMELDVLNKVSHMRLVPLLGHCLEHDSEKLLVYKYMPNGDLSNSLYRVTNLEDDNLQSLDWITRLKIAIGAAEGLSYLHHECSPPLVHRDVQASSILLDDKFEVRLGSLSEVCAQEGDSHQNVITKLLRKPQTSEQGSSGLLSATCAYDVYCFGKVLLELVTGKLGISKSDDATTREWLEHTLPCISIYDKELVTKIVDPSLIVDEDLLEEVWAMAIVARSCLNPKPSRRPLMRNILKALENPLKVVREESSSSARLRTTSSRRSWSTAFFGSWRHSSSEGAIVPGQINREGISGSKQSGRVGSQGSGGNDLSSSHKRSSNEIFPEPVDMQDIERQDQH
ncbi:hypothetical protein VitviT2T_027731 [Vitis vinifera]|uniref:Protein kinase domain-containing protein n=2 Tax=Vitis vinifera TaxID=29760 RepID=A0ABY9DSW9_VITVI|nr:probable LRR receptor-like serine/threonine-protein kinase At2g16250 [Vitis vinifera]WKA10142.1 hypothetical protein VitviT2T_027731 [Vitis vinifera]|eukprot:XP_002281409.1 PREDICTED: probable LRR receptor-like serine/threonine-protein kinase At2g16250 [Vitis vinifera]